MTTLPKTAEQIRDMPAGAEMDRLVAEHVMGWTAQDLCESKEEKEAGLSCYTWDGSAHFVDGMDAFRPSTNIAHAWEVIARMQELSFEPETGRHRGGFMLNAPDEKYGRDWSARFKCYHDESYGVTAPLAICRAALLSIAGEHNNEVKL